LANTIQLAPEAVRRLQPDLKPRSGFLKRQKPAKLKLQV